MTFLLGIKAAWFQNFGTTPKTQRLFYRKVIVQFYQKISFIQQQAINPHPLLASPSLVSNLSQTNNTDTSRVQNVLIRIVDMASVDWQTTAYVSQKLEEIAALLIENPDNLINFQPFPIHANPLYYAYTNVYKGPDSAEKQRVRQRLQGFNVNDNRAWEGLMKHFGIDVKHELLIIVARQMAKLCGLDIDRDTKRRKTMLIKWFDENWDQLKQYLPRFKYVQDQILFDEEVLE